MTTIAYRDGVLAADTLHSNNGIRVGYRPKIAVLPDGGWLATKGCSGYGHALLKWLEGGRQGEQPKGEGGGFLVHLDGTLEGFEGEVCEVFSGAPFYAFGSGAEIALGALQMGATAEQAIAAAIALDVYSGGEITVMRKA